MEYLPSKIPTENYVSTTRTNPDLDLFQTACMGYGFFDCQKFTSCMIRFDVGTVNQFPTGSIVCAGAKTEEEAMLAKNYFHMILRESHPQISKIQNEPLVVHNVVAAAKLPRAIDLERMFQNEDNNWILDDTYIALRWTVFPEKNITAVIYHTGGIVITGAKSTKESQETWDVIKPVLARYLKDPQGTEELDMDRLLENL